MFKSSTAISPAESASPATVGDFRLPEYVVQSLSLREYASDFEIDQILPPRLRDISDIHWSPVEVARKIALSLDDWPHARFIDVGAGVGKLCLLLALMTDLEIFGIEQREDLVVTARRICETNAPGRVQIMHGNMLDLDWDHFDVFYLYNPFQEHTCARGDSQFIDRSIPLFRKFYAKYIDEVFRQLVLLKSKKRVITFHGYGGRFPSRFKLLKSFKIENGTLNVFEKV